MTVLTTHEFGSAAEIAPVVALHGIRGHGRRWRTVHAAGADAGRLWYCPDLRGHGTSAHLPPWTLEQHVLDVLDTVDDLRLERFSLIGISFGGNVAARVAAQAPERVNALVLLDPALGLDPEYAGAQARSACHSPVFKDLDEARRTRARHWPPVPEPVIDHETREHLRRDEHGGLRWRYEPAAVVTAYSEMTRPGIFPPESVRTLLVRARRGSLVSSAYAEACAATGAMVTTIDAGHGMDIEDPAAVHGLIEEFLSA